MTVKFEMDGPLAIATFCGGPMNLLTGASFAGLMAAVDQALEAKARALLTVAEGEHFCAGADVIGTFVDNDANFARRKLNRWIPEIQRFENLPFPTVVAIRGMCLGGGCEMAQLHDILFAGESAHFGQVEARIGTTTLLGGAQRLLARVGLARAKEMVLSAGIYDARTMLDWGLINRVLPDDDVEAKARSYAMKLANGPTVAYAASKHLINTAVAHGLSAADQRLLDVGPATFASADMIDAVERFAAAGTDALNQGLSFKGE
ncbi:enoyl-CoA hydratase/isomerase family protein [Pseudomonas sp. Au-Pse12]|uniref:enoyl-CoA hydratase/isomerase family protein n=1 Tax=Pseudomonas sp. Au-Pse12 TaxID=2906459 RepID=UPI001E370906|nr:enoyl-CoA hydratase/isomerase family protein [Pseudomonas sp. Au-Pse12]MCE4052276.1 enoyl-CoA hydratase/isomerase family protein [Pseudomonas sp. Au-Pse12]